jgi:hypothetical protein
MIFKKLVKISFIGRMLLIVNSYVFNGDSHYSKKFAPIDMWAKAYLAPVFFSAILTLLSSDLLSILLLECAFIQYFTDFLTPISEFLAKDSFVNPGELILNIFPNLLGFGIGVYALIFGLSNTLVLGIQNVLRQSVTQGKLKAGSVLLLNAQMAYPLLVLSCAIAWGVFATLYIGSHFDFISIFTWFIFWFAFITLLQLISSLFSLGENELLIRLSSDEKTASQAQLKPTNETGGEEK